MAAAMTAPPVLAPGTRFSIWRPAGVLTVPGQGSYVQSFSPGAFGYAVGEVVALVRKGVRDGTARLESAQVFPDGSGVTLTYEVLTTGAVTSKEDYLAIGGAGMSDRAAADKLGVSRRTILRWKSELKAGGEIT
jgi:hypothetical protein